MNADATPMDADAPMTRISLPIMNIAELAIEGTDAPTCNAFSAFIGVASAFIGVSKDFCQP